MPKGEERMYQVIGAYFSPTGGTKRATETVCGLLGEAEYLDLGGRERAQRSFGPQELLVLALPVYAGQMPAVPGLLDGLKGDGTPCVVVATYGNRHYDDTLAQVQRLMEERGFRCVGAAAVITPHIFAPTLGVGRPDEEDIAKLEPFAKGVLKKLKEGNFAHVQLPGNPTPAPKAAVPVQKDRDWDTCLGCAICAKACPTQAMDLSTLLWEDSKCISCMSCVAACPTGALGYNSSMLAQKLTANFSQRRDVETFL